MGLFLMAVTSMLAELIIDSVGDGPAQSQFTLFLIAFQNPLYIMISITLAGFAHLSHKISGFYQSAAQSFFAEDKKQG